MKSKINKNQKIYQKINARNIKKLKNQKIYEINDRNMKIIQNLKKYIKKNKRKNKIKKRTYSFIFKTGFFS